MSRQKFRHVLIGSGRNFVGGIFYPGCPVGVTRPCPDSEIVVQRSHVLRNCKGIDVEITAELRRFGGHRRDLAARVDFYYDFRFVRQSVPENSGICRTVDLYSARLQAVYVTFFAPAADRNRDRATDYAGRSAFYKRLDFYRIRSRSSELIAQIGYLVAVRGESGGSSVKLFGGNDARIGSMRYLPTVLIGRILSVGVSDDKVRHVARQILRAGRGTE